MAAYDPEWEAKKAEGVALIRQGYSAQAAGNTSGVPRTTLQRALLALEAGKATSADLHAADQALMAKTYELATTAQAEQLERLRQGGVELKDVNGVAAMSLRAIGNYRRWNAPSMDSGEPGSASKLLDRLEAVLTSGASLSLTVSPRPTDADAIDIECVEDDDTGGVQP